MDICSRGGTDFPRLPIVVPTQDQLSCCLLAYCFWPFSSWRLYQWVFCVFPSGRSAERMRVEAVISHRVIIFVNSCFDTQAAEMIWNERNFRVEAVNSHKKFFGRRGFFKASLSCAVSHDDVLWCELLRAASIIGPLKRISDIISLKWPANLHINVRSRLAKRLFSRPTQENCLCDNGDL